MNVLSYVCRWLVGMYAQCYMIVCIYQGIGIGMILEFSTFSVNYELATDAIEN